MKTLTKTVESTFDFAFKCILYGGCFVLLFCYTDVYVKNKNVEANYRLLRDFVEEGRIASRNRRDAGKDSNEVIDKLGMKLETLEKRINKSDAFAKLVQTPFAALLPYLRGPVGFPGRPGQRGEDGRQGRKGKQGKAGPKGIKGEDYKQIRDDTGGNTYVRWGKTKCPDVEGTEFVYTGYAAGQAHTHTGGMSNTVCLHSQPTFGKFKDGVNTLQWIYGVEYEINSFNVLGKAKHDEDAPCSVCRAAKRGAHIMIPGRNICPSGWQREYKGYLMSAHYGHKGRSTAVCVDENAEGFPRSSASKDGNLWYTIQAACGSLPCGPYFQGRQLTCAVCTK